MCLGDCSARCLFTVPSAGKRTAPTKRPFWARPFQRGKLVDAVLGCVKCRFFSQVLITLERESEGKKSHILAWVNQRWRGITKAKARSGFWICYYLRFIRRLLNAYCISNHCLSISNPCCSLWAFFYCLGIFFSAALDLLLCKNIFKSRRERKRQEGTLVYTWRKVRDKPELASWKR